jgi:putative effector of murein hydrolase
LINSPYTTFDYFSDPGAWGFAVGIGAHGIGTARAFQLSEEAGAFSALAMGLNGIATSFLLPFLLWIMGLGSPSG